MHQRQKTGNISSLRRLLVIYLSAVITVATINFYVADCWTVVPLYKTSFNCNTYCDSDSGKRKRFIQALRHNKIMTFEKEDEETLYKSSSIQDKTSTETATEAAIEDETKPKWCPEKQIYLNGVIPSSTNLELEQVLNEDGSFRIFGYGSLCWNPGEPLSHEGIKTSYGKAIGWKRCWCQRSADHRGTPSFLGLVCTLLSDDEYRMIYKSNGGNGVKGNEDIVSMTEGVLYTVPKVVADDVLSELDFREKGVSF